MSRTSQGHYQTQTVATRDHLLIANRASRLYDRSDPMCSRGFNAVGKREEGVRRHHRPACALAGFVTGEHDRVNPTHLTGAYADSRAILGIYDGVAFDMAADAPRKGKVSQLRCVRTVLGYDAPVGRIEVLSAVVRFLDQGAGRRRCGC